MFYHVKIACYQVVQSIAINDRAEEATWQRVGRSIACAILIVDLDLRSMDTRGFNRSSPIVLISTVDHKEL